MEQISAKALCPLCAKLDLAAYFTRAIHSRIDHFDSHGPTSDAVNLGNLPSLAGKSHTCAFCRLIVKAILGQNYDPETSLSRLSSRDDQFVYIYSYVYGRNLLLEDDENSAKAYRIGIAVEQNDAAVCSLGEHVGSLCLLSEDAARVSGTPLASGRMLHPERADMHLVRTWLRACESEHEAICEQTLPDPAPGLETLPDDLFVIDVESWRITTLPEGCRYLALSYRWPMSGAFMLTENVLDELLKVNSLKECQLSRKITDAIRCIADLGEKFLWVDALCIIQDSHEHKAQQISQMDRIYGSAALIIVAAPSYHKADDGSLKESYNGLPRYSGVASPVKQHTETVQGMKLMVPFDNVNQSLFSTEWNTRAWTFQESVLAKRRLYFTDGQVHFQCSCATYCEDGVGEGIDREAWIAPQSNLWNMGNIFTRTSYFGNTHLKRTRYLHAGVALADFDTFLSNYTARSMTVPTDIVNAFLGIQKIMEKTMDTGFIHCLPVKYLHKTILWTTLDNFRRESVASYYPSWSWTGWMGKVAVSPYFYISGYVSEALFYIVDACRRATLIAPEGNEDIANPRPIAETFTEISLSHSNQRVGPQSSANPDKWLRIDAKIWRDGKEEMYNPQFFLGCYTTIATLMVTLRISPLFNHGLLWNHSTNLRVCDLKGRWCGCVLLHDDWIFENLEGGPDMLRLEGRTEDSRPVTEDDLPDTSFLDIATEFEFILLSRSKGILPLTPPPKLFDDETFEDRQWALLNVMMVSRRNDIVERLAVGYVHEDAWADASSREIQALML